jgi:capsular exopolysaccharide synthesis family protein
MVSLMFSIMLAFLLEALSNTVRHGNDVIEKIRVPLLALIPLLSLPKKQASLIGHKFLERSEPAFSEAIRTLRTGINLSGLDKSMKTIMVTSSTSGEGKTSVACNLALAFAQIERVLLIDIDMRRPTVAQEFQIAREQPGLSALCAGTASASECIVRRTADNLDVLTAGVIPPNPQELLSSQKFRMLVTKLSEHYDRVIFDCPPVLPVSDALLLANVVSAVIYVVRAEKTPVSQICRGIEQLRRTRVEVLGVVLNQVDTQKIAAYGEYGGAYMAEDYSVMGAN